MRHAVSCGGGGGMGQGGGDPWKKGAGRLREAGCLKGEWLTKMGEREK